VPFTFLLGLYSVLKDLIYLPNKNKVFFLISRDMEKKPADTALSIHVNYFFVQTEKTL
jgi:hypothetical protein